MKIFAGNRVKNVFLCLFSLCVYQSLFAQHESDHWYFGISAGIDFSSGSPVSVSGGQTNQWEGVSSISDANGNFLFYTDGITVWDRNHNIMPNGTGLDGDYSSTQSGLIVQLPGSSTQYYVFTADNEAGPNGLRYSTVDMTLNGGLGDVVAKNVLVYAPTTEKIGIVKHNNGQDIWVVSHEWDSNNFRAYLLTSSGLNLTPVISSAGSIVTGNTGNTIGYLKFNPQACKIACAIFSGYFFELYDFDDATGAVSNALTFPANYNRIYGMEFSPDGTKLYSATNGYTSDIWQYDITSGTVSGILATEYLVGTYGYLYALGAAQIGPDYKIYFARNAEQYLDVVNNPNESGAACNYVSNGLALTSGTCQLGLPTFVQSFFNASDTMFSQIYCLNTPSQFQVPDSGNISVTWNFGDTASGIADTASGGSVQHQFSDTGLYIITAYVQFTCKTDTITQLVLIADDSPIVDLGNDTTLCDGNIVLLDATNGNSSYQWQDGSTAATFQVSSTGLYFVTVTNACGSDQDSINVDFLPAPVFSLGPDTTLCTGADLLLSITLPGVSIQWQDGSAGTSYLVIQPGTYWAQVSNGLCLFTDSIVITGITPPLVNLGNDTTLCTPNLLLLDASFPGATYQWQDSSTSATYQVSTSGLYFVTVTNPCGTDDDTINVAFIPSPIFSLGPDTVLCSGDTFTLNINVPGANILWQDGSSSSTFIVTQAGYYWAEVSNSCGTDFDSIQITGLNAPIVDLGNDTTLCFFTPIVLNATNAGSSYLWQDSSAFSTYSSSTSGLFWVIVSNPCGIATDSINLNLIVPPSVNLGNDTLLCSGATLTLDAGNTGAQYLWDDGSILQTVQVAASGEYWVEVQDSICMASDTILIDYLAAPQIELGNDTAICFGETFIIVPGVNDSSSYFTWQDGSHNETMVAAQSDLYILMASNSCGQDVDSANVNYIDCSCDLHIPDAFSPNGDGVNDLFFPLYYCPVVDYDFKIFNRWGELVFETNDIDKKWNGTHKEILSEIGVFVYVINYTNSLTGAKRMLKGNVTLIL